MPVIATIKNPGAGGAFFRANGKKKPDSWLFTRNVQRSGNYDFVFPTIENFNQTADDLIGAQGNPPIQLTVLPEPGAAEKGLQEEHEKAIKVLGFEFEARGKRIDEMAAEINGLRSELIEAQEGGTSGLTDVQRECLKVHDDLIELLIPQRVDQETPVQVLQRILGHLDDEKPVDESPAPGSEPNKEEANEPAPKPLSKKAQKRADAAAKKAAADKAPKA